MLILACVYPTGLYENYPTNAEPECCDVRWGLLSDHQSKGTIKTSGSTMCHRTSLTVSSASRLCNSRLKLCVLVLILLHTVLTVSAAQNSTGLGFGGITTLEDNSTNEEWKTNSSYMTETQEAQVTTVKYKNDWVLYPQISSSMTFWVKGKGWATTQTRRTQEHSFLLTKRLYGDLNFSHHFIHCVLMFGVSFFVCFLHLLIQDFIFGTVSQG